MNGNEDISALIRALILSLNNIIPLLMEVAPSFVMISILFSDSFISRVTCLHHASCGNQRNIFIFAVTGANRAKERHTMRSESCGKRIIKNGKNRNEGQTEFADASTMPLLIYVDQR
jgi:hypothetical protein